ncbi:MAG: mitochondrial fusion and transport protein ugo1 [Piccolia ochrophora]|nr:MAG: mitochondrial fusion and transport protein ugo1 [Piccolia ochrophora]
MASPLEGPNPLRPYYIPPSVSPSPDVIGASTPLPGRGPSTASTKPTSSSSPSFSFSDLDYNDILSDHSPSVAEVTRRLLDQALWKYTSVLMAQPFEVAKTILQCQVAPGGTPTRPSGHARSRPQSYRADPFDDRLSDDSDPDEPAYFTSHAPQSRHNRSPMRGRPTSSRTTSNRVAPPQSSPHKLDLVSRGSIVEVMSQLWQKEGAWGVWKGANATFIYSVLLRTVESWTRGLLAAIFNVPDPGLLAGVGIGGVDIADSLYPWASFSVAVAAAGIAGVLLAPLDIVRTSTIPSMFASSTPLFLRSRLGIDPVFSPTTYSFCTFLSATAELFVRLPIETVLRRGQIGVAQSQGPGKPPPQEPAPMVVDVGPFRGTVGTMWAIVREEGGEEPPAKGASGTPGTPHAKAKRGRGQGVEGLWRGWRVGMWGLVGVWGAGALGSGGGGTGGEF